jgi:hypothetical protein
MKSNLIQNFIIKKDKLFKKINKKNEVNKNTLFTNFKRTLILKVKFI